MRLGRIPGVRQIPPLLQRVDHHTVLFDSWHGTYSDNPRAISEGLRLRDPAYEQFWTTDDAGSPYHTRRYLEALGRARYVVTNVNMPGYYRKKRGTTYVQTWHGTPLKRIGFDIERPTFPGSRSYLAGLAGDVAKWDVLVSPNRFSTEVFRRAFRYEGRIIETGYPRNDVLSSSGAGGIGETVRKHLGVPERASVVLYAPTWKDTESFELELDLRQLTEELGSDWRLLLRAHIRVADTAGQQAAGHVINVSDYPDIRDLYLAADVLLTDYSSAMFDFAVTGKPMLFYTYDLAHYRDEVRGFCFDFEREAPGPLLVTTADVCEALQELDDVTRRYADPYAHFVERYCYLEDGRASERVIDAVFTD
jgi:CDP-glycerol glycerophosphotransferase